MRRTVKILASVFLIAGLAAGIGISYSDYDPDLEEGSTRFDDCPAYATAKPIFEARSGKSWFEAGQFAAAGGQATEGALAAELPRANFIDDHIFDKMAADSIPSAPLCTDEEFIRRVYLDLTGRIPTAEEVRNFKANRDASKREQLVDTLLQTPEYVDRMTMWFGDLFQTGYPILYYGRSAFNSYLRKAVENNKPYNEIVTELLTALGDSWDPESGPVNFLARAWEPMVNQFDVRDNIAAQTSKVFLGVPALCISCHGGARHLEQVNTYLSQKTRRDLWGLAAFFSGVNYRRERRLQQPNRYAYTFDERPSEGYDLDSPQARGGIRPGRGGGAIIPPKYFFTGAEPDKADSSIWRSGLAQIITSDPQFAKATVNYLWKEFFGMGIVDPPEAFDLARTDQATHPELLQALGDEFVSSGYDIKHTIELMVKSTTYRLSARFPGRWEGRYAQYFARHFAKRMTAEMIIDAIVKSSGVPNTYTLEMYPGDVQEFQWAMQLPDTVEPRAVREITGRAAQANAASRTFLNLFFRGDRNVQPRKIEGSVQQALALMNGPIVLDRAQYGSGGIVDTLADDKSRTLEQIIEELFLATVSRYPTTQEKTEALTELNKDRTRGAENLYLALLNKLDFIFY